MSAKQTSATQVDAIVIGAGLSGLYQLYQLREHGLKVCVLEAGSGVAGTWYWNRYPGARCDSTAECYQYWFSDELLNEWNWSERFPAQAETERYLNHVADKFDLRREIQFNTSVSAADFDEANSRWIIRTQAGDTYCAQFVVMATGGRADPMSRATIASKACPCIPRAGRASQSISAASAWVLSALARPAFK